MTVIGGTVEHRYQVPTVFNNRYGSYHAIGSLEISLQDAILGINHAEMYNSNVQVHSIHLYSIQCPFYGLNNPRVLITKDSTADFGQ